MSHTTILQEALEKVLFQLDNTDLERIFSRSSEENKPKRRSTRLGKLRDFPLTEAFVEKLSSRSYIAPDVPTLSKLRVEDLEALMREKNLPIPRVVGRKRAMYHAVFFGIKTDVGASFFQTQELKQMLKKKGIHQEMTKKGMVGVLFPLDENLVTEKPLPLGRMNAIYLAKALERKGIVIKDVFGGVVKLYPVYYATFYPRKVRKEEFVFVSEWEVRELLETNSLISIRGQTPLETLNNFAKFYKLSFVLGKYQPPEIPTAYISTFPLLHTRRELEEIAVSLSVRFHPEIPSKVLVEQINSRLLVVSELPGKQVLSRKIEVLTPLGSRPCGLEVFSESKHSPTTRETQRVSGSLETEYVYFIQFGTAHRFLIPEVLKSFSENNGFFLKLQVDTKVSCVSQYIPFLERIVKDSEKYSSSLRSMKATFSLREAMSKGNVQPEVIYSCITEGADPSLLSEEERKKYNSFRTSKMSCLHSTVMDSAPVPKDIVDLLLCFIVTRL